MNTPIITKRFPRDEGQKGIRICLPKSKSFFSNAYVQQINGLLRKLFTKIIQCYQKRKFLLWDIGNLNKQWLEGLGFQGDIQIFCLFVCVHWGFNVNFSEQKNSEPSFFFSDNEGWLVGFMACQLLLSYFTLSQAWHNSYRHRKWNWQSKFKSGMRLFELLFMLTPLRKA